MDQPCIQRVTRLMDIILCSEKVSWSLFVLYSEEYNCTSDNEKNVLHLYISYVPICNTVVSLYRLSALHSIGQWWRIYDQRIDFYTLIIIYIKEF